MQDPAEVQEVLRVAEGRARRRRLRMQKHSGGVEWCTLQRQKEQAVAWICPELYLGESSEGSRGLRSGEEGERVGRKERE